MSKETPIHPVDPPGDKGYRIRVVGSMLMARLMKAKDEDAARSEDKDNETEADTP